MKELSKQAKNMEKAEKTESAPVPVNRRDFLKTACRTLALAVMAVGFRRLVNLKGGETVWQIDPKKCIHCGLCATDCVLDRSAVRCVRAFDVCGYCKLCGGYHRISSGRLDTAAENQVCPTGALVRTFVEEPFYEYRVIEELCNGCGLCAKGCTAFGNGSLYLQIKHHLCAGCNECRLAVVCPAQAISQVSLSNPYVSPM